MVSFEQELENLLNRYSMESGSDTPDFILCQYLQGCLDNFNRTIQERERWHGRELTYERRARERTEEIAALEAQPPISDADKPSNAD